MGRCTGASSRSTLTAVEEVVEAMSRGISPNMQHMTSSRMKKVSVRLQYMCTTVDVENKPVCGEPALALLLARSQKLLHDGELTLNDLENIQPFEFTMTAPQKDIMETLVKDIVDFVRKVAPSKAKKRGAPKDDDTTAATDDVMDLFA